MIRFRVFEMILVAAVGFIHATSAQPVVLLDTVYTPAGYEDGPLMATIYLPNVPNGVGAVLTHYYTGNRQVMRAWGEFLASNGYVAMAIDYYDFSNSTYGVYPKPIRAFKIAVEFLRRNAARFGITTRRIVGLGQSEGAIHWGEAIIWDNRDEYFQTDHVIDDHLDAVVLLHGSYDNSRFLQSVLGLDQLLTNFFAPAPDLRATRGDCIANAANITTPVLLVHGTSDAIIQYQQSVQLHDSLLALGKSSRLVLFSGQHHGFDVTFNPPQEFTADGMIVRDSVLAFLRGTLHLTDVGQEPVMMPPRRYSLEQNYPNPFNPKTVISCQWPVASDVKLVVYDVLGREVAVLMKGWKEAGKYTVEFDASGLSSGVYVYTLRAGESVESKKLLVLR